MPTADRGRHTRGGWRRVGRRVGRPILGSGARVRSGLAASPLIRGSATTPHRHWQGTAERRHRNGTAKRADGVAADGVLRPFAAPGATAGRSPGPDGPDPVRPVGSAVDSESASALGPGCTRSCTRALSRRGPSPRASPAVAEPACRGSDWLARGGPPRAADPNAGANEPAATGSTRRGAQRPPVGSVPQMRRRRWDAAVAHVAILRDVAPRHDTLHRGTRVSSATSRSVRTLSNSESSDRRPTSC